MVNTSSIAELHDCMTSNILFRIVWYLSISNFQKKIKNRKTKIFRTYRTLLLSASEINGVGGKSFKNK